MMDCTVHLYLNTNVTSMQPIYHTHPFLPQQVRRTAVAITTQLIIPVIPHAKVNAGKYI